MLLFSARYRQELEAALRSSNRGFFYSAFFTSDGGRWLARHRAFKESDRLLVRALPADFIAGACSFEALRCVLDQGLAVRMSSALHAKVYVFDEFVFAGSANLTAKGLALSEDANVEIGVMANLTDEDVNALERLWNQGAVVDQVALARMQTYVDSIDQNGQGNKPTGGTIWPGDVIEEVRDLYCSDFPSSFPSNDLRWADRTSFKQTMAYKWLLSQVSVDEVSFGFLSEQLHSAVCDDPTPYRREIKELLANLLSAVQVHDKEILEVLKPSHRQSVRRRE